MKNFYLLMAVIGFILPCAFLASFLVDNGLDLPLLIDQLFANDISTLFAVDLIISTIVFLAFVIPEAQRYRVDYWGLVVIASLVVGLSLALPLFLYVRQTRLETRLASSRVGYGHREDAGN